VVEKAMITGVVKADEGRIRLTVKGPRGRGQEVQAIVATGYTASLMLPAGVVAALGLRWHSRQRFTLADGSGCVFDVYIAKVDWDGKVRTVLIEEGGPDPLVGMKLLRGHELKMHIRARGKVTIKRLPAK
jgi:clan AA aspartic protease